MRTLPLGLPGLQPIMMRVSAGHAEPGITGSAQADGAGLVIPYGWKFVTIVSVYQHGRAIYKFKYVT